MSHTACSLVSVETTVPCLGSLMMWLEATMLNVYIPNCDGRDTASSCVRHRLCVTGRGGWYRGSEGRLPAHAQKYWVFSSIHNGCVWIVARRHPEIIIIKKRNKNQSKNIDNFSILKQNLGGVVLVEETLSSYLTHTVPAETDVGEKAVGELQLFFRSPVRKQPFF